MEGKRRIPTHCSSYVLEHPNGATKVNKKTLPRSNAKFTTATKKKLRDIQRRHTEQRTEKYFSFFFSKEGKSNLNFKCARLCHFDYSFFSSQSKPQRRHLTKWYPPPETKKTSRFPQGFKRKTLRKNKSPTQKRREPQKKKQELKKDKEKALNTTTPHSAFYSSVVVF